jgi:hypothetical protein
METPKKLFDEVYNADDLNAINLILKVCAADYKEYGADKTPEWKGFSHYSKQIMRHIGRKYNV